MKIVYTISGTYNSGGMERVLANKANYLVNQGFNVTIVTTDQQGRTPYFRLHPNIAQIDLGINYTDNNDRGLLGKLVSYPLKQLKHRKALNDTLEQMKVDIAVSMFDHDADLLWKIQDGSKKVLEIHFSRYKRLQYGRKGLWKWVDIWRNRKDLEIAKHYEKFVVLTEEDKGYWGGLPNIEVIPNAHSFETDTVSTLDQKHVIAVGRYDYQKGFDELIDIWSKVSPLFPDWKLDVFGKGPLKGDLLLQISKLGLGHVVALRGPVSNIQEKYLNSSILAMTSRYEGLPMALLEAQVCGLPMIAYACKCGPRDIIEDGINGFLIGEGEQDVFANRLKTLMGDYSLRIAMGKASREISVRFSEEVVMAKWLRLFGSLKPEST